MLEAQYDERTARSEELSNEWNFASSFRLQMIVNNLIIALPCVVFHFLLVSAKTFLIVHRHERQQTAQQGSQRISLEKLFFSSFFMFLHLTPLRAGVTQHNSAERLYF
jgi:hypothetical protein